MNYDVLVVGSGPAGLAAAVAARGRDKSVLVVGNPWQESPLARAERIDNYLGLPGVNGRELMEHFSAHAQRVGVEFHTGRVVAVMAWEGFALTAGSEVFQGRTLVLAPGVARLAKYPGEAELLGRGVSYCATCDGSFFRGKTVMVVGGGNTAAADAIYLSRLAERVILVHRRDKLRATPVYHEQLAKLENVSFMWNTEVRALRGEEGKLVSAQVEHLGDGALETVPVDGVFVAVGTQPNTEFLAGALPLDAGGYIVASETGETSIPGVFAAGDVRAKALRQVVTAVSDGAVCAEQAANHVAI